MNGFGWNLGTPSTLFGSGPDRFWARSAQKRERETLRKFCLLSGKQRTTLPISGQPNFTKFAHKLTWFCEAVNPFGNIFFEKLALRGLFFQKNPWSSSTIADFRSQYLRNDYKSWKVTTGWRAYGMLAFRPYRWNQLSHSPGQQAPYEKGLFDFPDIGGSSVWCCRGNVAKSFA